MVVMDSVRRLLGSCEGQAPVLPPTLLYNENWLLRLVLDWFAGRPGEPHPLAPMPGASWFSEAWLPSAFLPRYRRDRLAESWTHADGVVGHFTTGNRGLADLALSPEARQFAVIEGKMFSRLSAGVKNAPCYDQAARSVACIAEALRRAGREAGEMEDVSFTLVAPQSRIDEGAFADEMRIESIVRKVRRRAEEYAGARDAWLEEWFEPTAEHLTLRCLSWESLAELIAVHDPAAGQAIDAFYGNCLRLNRPRAVSLWIEVPPPSAPTTAADLVTRPTLTAGSPDG